MAKRALKAGASKPAKRSSRARYFILQLDTFEGEDTACYLLGADPMWIVISASPTGGAAVVDCGYRSVKEAREAWPDAIPPAPDKRVPLRSVDCYRPVFSEPWFQEFWKKLKKMRPQMD